MLCLVGRELCLYALIDARKVPAAQRADYVALAVRRCAPFDDPDYGLAWQGDYAAVWYWSRERALTVLGSPPARVRFVPEALFVGEATDQPTLQLLQMVHGVEARAWKHGRLLASRWWPEAPGDAEWKDFARGAGFAGDSTVQASLAAPIREQSWALAGSPRSGTSWSTLGTLAPKATFMVALLFTAAASTELGAIARGYLQIYQASRAADSLDEPLKEILTAREQVDRDQAQITALLALRPPQRQLELMAEAAKRLPRGNWQLQQWRQPGPGRVEVTLAWQNPDLEALVKGWEESPMFTDVSTDVAGRRDLVTIRAQVEAANGEPR